MTTGGDARVLNLFSFNNQSKKTSSYKMFLHTLSVDKSGLGIFFSLVDVLALLKTLWSKGKTLPCIL